MPPRPPLLDVASVMVSATTLARWHEAAAQDLETPIAAIRAGAVVPPATLIGLLRRQQESHRREGAHALLVSTMLVRWVAAPPSSPPPTWWRRALAAFRARALRGRHGSP